MMPLAKTFLGFVSVTIQFFLPVFDGVLISKWIVTKKEDQYVKD